MQFVAVDFARLALLYAVLFFDNTDCLVVFAIWVPSMDWLRLSTSDKTTITWATIRQADLRFMADLSPDT